VHCLEAIDHAMRRRNQMAGTIVALIHRGLACGNADDPAVVHVAMNPGLPRCVFAGRARAGQKHGRRMVKHSPKSPLDVGDRVAKRGKVERDLSDRRGRLIAAVSFRTTIPAASAKDITALPLPPISSDENHKVRAVGASLYQTQSIEACIAFRADGAPKALDDVHKPRLFQHDSLSADDNLKRRRGF